MMFLHDKLTGIFAVPKTAWCFLYLYS